MSTFQKGDYVVYSKVGICLIEDLQSMSFAQGQESVYYILKPLGSKPNDYVYVDTGNSLLTSKMRAPFSEKEIPEIIEKSEDFKIEWIDDKNRRQMAFKEIISGGNRSALLALIKCMYDQIDYRESQGKKLPSSDVMLLETSEKLINQEFAFSLKKEEHEIKDYIMNILKESE